MAARRARASFACTASAWTRSSEVTFRLALELVRRAGISA